MKAGIVDYQMLENQPYLIAYQTQKLIRHSRSSGFVLTRNSKLENEFSNQKQLKKAATAHSKTDKRHSKKSISKHYQQ